MHDESSSNCTSRDLYSPIVVFSSWKPRALKKNESTVVSREDFLMSISANFVSVDLPEPGFPLIQKNPWCSESFSTFVQSEYSLDPSSHLQVFAWPRLMFK